MNSITNSIGFPGFGIGPFNIDPIAVPDFIFPGWNIAWYGIFVTLGILGGIFYAFWRGQKNNSIIADDMIDVAFFSIPAAIIGARIYYVIFKFDIYSKNPGEIFKVWNGGIAIYGGIIFGLIAAFCVCKFKKLSFLKVFDSTAPAIMLGQIIGRWGNFTNMEAYGAKTALPWRMSIERLAGGYVPYSEVHPTFLYECLWNLVGFILINLLYKKKKFDGQIFLMYITWYGFGRMLIEGLRTDSLYLGSFRISQIVGFLCFVGGVILLILGAVRYKNQKLEGEAYEGVYSSAKEKLSENEDGGGENKDETEPEIETEEEKGPEEIEKIEEIREVEEIEEVEEKEDSGDENQ